MAVVEGNSMVRKSVRAIKASAKKAATAPYDNQESEDEDAMMEELGNTSNLRVAQLKDFLTRMATTIEVQNKPLEERNTEHKKMQEMVERLLISNGNQEAKIEQLIAAVAALHEQNALEPPRRNRAHAAAPTLHEQKEFEPPQRGQTYAAVAALGRAEPSEHRLLPPAMLAKQLFCTIDVERAESATAKEKSAASIRGAIEREIRGGDNGDKAWRCAAVTRDGRHPHRIRVIRKDEEELEKVKKAAEATLLEGARVLRDQLYPVKVDNSRADTILKPDGKLKDNVLEGLGEENNTKVAKVAWLSGRETKKAYGSMVVYFTKGADAVRFLKEGYFYVGGESAIVRPFEHRTGPTRCFHCHQLGHRAFHCQNPVRCAKSAGKHVISACKA